MFKIPQDYQDVKLVNCAECRQEMLGESMADLVAQYGRDILPLEARGLPMIGGRMEERPYCQGCLVARFLPNPSSRSKGVGSSF